MTTFQIAVRKFGVHFAKPIWSFIRNCWFWLWHLNDINEARKIKADIKHLNIETLMERFIWKEDKAGDWTPWIMTIIRQSFSDDCDGAAALAKWWFKEHGIEAEILNLYSEKEGHAVCVTKSRGWMVTNERVVMLHPDNWEIEVLEYFGGKYETII
jgi:hypothetical protein